MRITPRYANDKSARGSAHLLVRQREEERVPDPEHVQPSNKLITLLDNMRNAVEWQITSAVSNVPALR